MNCTEKYVQSKGLIHYLDSKEESNTQLTPIVVCPGLSETADEYRVFMERAWPRRVLALSFRGRGKSESVSIGYGLDGHVEDIHAVVKEESITSCWLVAFSRGVSYALAFAKQNPELVKGLILLDYPPVHKAMSAEWADYYINEYLIPTQRTEQISTEAVYGIHKDSTDESLVFPYENPVLIIHGTTEQSLINETAIDQYKSSFTHLSWIGIENKGHDLRSGYPLVLDNYILDFIKQNDH